MRLDHLGGRALRRGLAALDNVRVGRPLHHEVDVAELGGRVFKDAHEGIADAATLLLRLRDALEVVKEAVAGIHEDELDAEVTTEGFLHLLRFALAHYAVVNENAGE